MCIYVECMLVRMYTYLMGTCKHVYIIHICLDILHVQVYIRMYVCVYLCIYIFSYRT